jgi:hypothetical protein
MGFLVGALKVAAGPLIQYFQKKQEMSNLEHQAAIDIRKAQVEADIKRVQAGQEAENDWNIKSLATSPWRSEYLTIILSIPLIMVFIRPLVPYVMQGFMALEKTPVWYRSMVFVMVASAFGYQKLMNWMDSK